MVRNGAARRLSAALLVACATYITVDTYFFSLIKNQEHSSRSLEADTEAGTEAGTECEIKSLHQPEQFIVPVFAASYPGSGSGMTHYLYEALTGFPAATGYTGRGDEGIYVALKTHFPTRKHNVLGSKLMDRAILHLRNPLHAIPSYASQVYEAENHLPSHTKHAPVEYWIKWRDENFVEEIKNWAKHLQYWANNYDHEDGKRIVISYEHLINEETGPEETSIIAQFLGEGEGVSIASPENMPCIWDRVVNYQKYAGEKEPVEDKTSEKLVDIEGGRKLVRTNDLKVVDIGGGRTLVRVDDLSNLSIGSSRGAKVDYNFSQHQLRTMSDILGMLKDKYQADGNEDRLVTILNEYLEEVEEKLKDRLVSNVSEYLGEEMKETMRD